MMRRTRTATRRSGDDYQDLVAAAAMLRVLENPSLYRWIKLEAAEAGKLDDVVALRVDGTVEATQVKFSTDVLRPGDPLTWKDLLHQRHGDNTPSLIQQWQRSVVALDELYGKTEPRLFSNRKAGDDLFLTASGLIDVTRTGSDVLDQIKEQLGEGADDFIKRFRFQVNEQGFPDLKARLQLQFQARALPESNWLGFLDQIRSWIRCENLPPDGEIRISHIRQACGWTRLSRLTQELEVPQDFVVADDAFHGRLLERVKNGDDPVIVVTAGPGIGKSTYLSYLVDALRESGSPVVRHHYSLGPSRDRLERVEAHRIAESLMADLQTDLRSYVDGRETVNPNPTEDLRIWLEEIGKRLSEEDKHLVVVVDGLDHVWRAKDSRDELTKLFDHLLPAPEGVVLVVGTQPVQDQQLPVSFLTCAPRDRWFELPPLDQSAVRKWLDHHTNLMPPEWSDDRHQWHRVELANSLHQRTAGHPLLMRYIVERIARAGDYLSASTVEAIPETPAQSVEEYYRSLWLSIPDHAKDVMFLFAAARFRWPENGLREALRNLGYDRANALDGVDAVQHLLWNDGIGWQPFHNSILLFVTEQPEFASRRDELRQAAISWLEDQAPLHLRRSQLWLLQREAGDSEPLMAGTNRQWLVETLAAGDPLPDIVRVMQIAATESIKAEDYPRYVDRGILADVVEHTVPIQYDAVRWIFEAQLSMAGGEGLAAREMTKLAELSDSSVASLARFFHAKSDSSHPDSCFEQMRRRLNREHNNLHIWEEERARPGILSELAGLIGFGPKRFAQFINQLDSEAMRASLVERWIAGLRQSGGRQDAIEALGEQMGSASMRCLSRYLAVDSVSEGMRLSDTEAEALMSPYPAVYRILRDPNAAALLPEDPELPTDEFRRAFDEYEQEMAYYLHDLFFCWLVHELQSPGHCRQWTAPAAARPWLKSALAALALGAEEIAAQWRAVGKIAVTAVYSATGSLGFPSIGGDRWLIDQQCADALRRALQTIAEDLLVCRRAVGGNALLSWDEVQALASHRFAGTPFLIGCLAEGDFTINEETLRNFCDLVDDAYADTIEPFSDRAAGSAMMATICARQGLQTEAQRYLVQACENLVGYGYHKDLLLDTTLNTLGIVGEHMQSCDTVWARLAPVIGAVDEFTDGDETNHLASKLGGLMLRLDPELATRYLTTLMDEESYRHIQQTLEELVSTGDLTDPDVRALVSTCIDPRPIEILERRAAEGSEHVAETLSMTPGYSSTFSPTNSQRSTNGSPTDDMGTWTTSVGVSSDQCQEYPPEELGEFIRQQGDGSSYRVSQALCAWLCSWSETDHARDALEAAAPHLLDDDRFQVTNSAATAAMRIVGRTKGYDWLVKAHRSNHGWHEHMTSIKETRERWRWLKHDFPNGRHQFLLDSIEPRSGFSWYFGMTVTRLAEYLGHFDQWDDACAIATQLVDTVAALAGGQTLPAPPCRPCDRDDQ